MHFAYIFDIFSLSIISALHHINSFMLKSVAYGEIEVFVNVSSTACPAVRFGTVVKH